MAKLIISLIVAGWICAIALIALQNATPITLRFLVLETVQMPLGLVIAFSAALGLVGTAIVLPLWQLGSSASRRKEDFEP